MKKLKYITVHNFIESFEYELVSNSYIDANSKLDIICPKGHEFKMKYNSFKQGQRCPTCFGTKKHTIEYVRNYMLNENYTLLSDTYINNRTKLLVKCDKGHEYDVSFGSFRGGKRCPICNGGIKLTYEYVKDFINSTGYTLLSNTYENSHTKLLLKCDKGHEYKATFGSFRGDHGCPTCAGNSRHTIDYIRNFINSTGYTLLSDTYKNSNTKLSVRCDKGHEYKVTFGNFGQGWRCPICNGESYVSKGEKDVAKFVQSLGFNIIENDRTQLINPLTNRNLELDIWIPSIKKAIEYNGIYWHSLLEKVKTDKIKQQQCKQLNIDLLVVHEDNWINNRVVEQQIIDNFLNGGNKHDNETFGYFE